MSSFNFVKAFNKEKPHSSVTDWVEILTSSSIEEEAYDGIPELVDSINLQAAGPTEASRALRKKLKHGNPHQQYRALVILKALVENGGPKFKNTFADGQLTDALKQLGNDFNTDKKVKKKLMAVLAAWRNQFKNDPSMALVANLYTQTNIDPKRYAQQELAEMMGLTMTPEEKLREEAKEAKRQAKREKLERAAERHKNHEDKPKKPKKRVPFDFEKEKPKIIAAIAEASQAASNLINAITLVNPTNDCVETNERVQDCLEKAKQAKKFIVRYIQLVENEEVIGTLIETNERLMSSLELYEDKTIPDSTTPANPTDEITTKLAQTNLESSNDDALLQSNAATKGKSPDPSPFVHPDLEDLNFGSIGHASNLPAPLRPSTLSDDNFSPEERDVKGSLSDFSDYDSSDEEVHDARPGPSSKRDYATVSDSDGEQSKPFRTTKTQLNQVEDDPFADPFADK